MATTSTTRLLLLGASALLAISPSSIHARASLQTGHTSSSSQFEEPGSSTKTRHVASLHRADEFFADVPTLIRAWRALPPSARKQSRVLAEIRVDDLGDDYQSTQHMQRVIAFGTAADVESFGTQAIQYSPEKQQLTVLCARVHGQDGRIERAQDLGESASGDTGFSDTRVHRYRFRGLRPGDVVELEYKTSPLPNSNVYGNYFAELIAFGGPFATDMQRYVLRAPADIHLSGAERFVGAPEIHTERDEQTYSWVRTDIPGLVREPRSPSWSEQGAYVHVSTFATWEELGRWYAGLLRPQLALNAELQRLAADIVATHPDRLERVMAIEQLVSRRTRYGALEIGAYGFKPYPVTQTFSRGFGDCKDKAALMIALLRASGIAADMALVRTRELGEILPQPASASIFDHAVVYVPEFDLWIDGTAEYAHLGELPVEDQGAMALTIDAQGNAVMRHTPLSSAADNYSRRTIDARLEANGTIRFSGATYLRGEDAPEVRRQLAPGESKVGYVRERLAQVLPAVEVRHVDLPKVGSEAVSLNFDGDVLTFRGARTATLPSSWMQRNYVSTLTPDDCRTQELVLDVPWTTEEQIQIRLPEGARVWALPSSETIESQFGNAHLNYQSEAGHITIATTVQFTQTSIPASEYQAFREFTAKLEKAFSRSIEVELP